MNGGHRRQSSSPRFDNVPDCYPDGLAILAGVLLRGLAPASVEQRAGRRHTGRRWGGLGAADARQRADGERGLRPRQRSNISCVLSHLSSFCPPSACPRAAYRAQELEPPDGLIRRNRNAPCSGRFCSAAK